MLVKTNAIVIHSFKYGDNKVIVDMVTAELGRVACIAAMPKSPKARLKRQYFQPLYILETVIDVRQRSRLQKLREAHIAVALTSIPLSPAKTAITLFTAEFLRQATRTEPVDKLTYTYIEDSIRWLDGSPSRYANFHLVFMMRMAKFLGFAPNTDGYTPGCRFDLRASCFRTGDTGRGDCLPEDESRNMLQLLRMNFPNMHLYKMSRKERDRMADVILKYYQIHIPGFQELNSLPVLKELFG